MRKMDQVLLNVSRYVIILHPNKKTDSMYMHLNHNKKD